MGNQETGQAYDARQDENQSQESSESLKEQARYFQSEKDKLYAENQKLKKYEQVGQFLESRPDLVDKLQDEVSGQPERVDLESDDFVPWEAYNDPSSKSYQYRMQETQDQINNAMQYQSAAMNESMGMQRLDQELTNRGLDTEQIQSFKEFASRNPAEYGMDTLINWWQQHEQGADNPQHDLNDVRRTQSIPSAGGILQGQQPQQSKASDSDELWSGVLNATRVGNKIP